MATIKEIENLRLDKAQDLCKLVEMIGYGRGACGQLQNSNGSFVSSLLDFFDDNPGAMEAVAEFIMEHHATDEDEEVLGVGCTCKDCQNDIF